MGSPEHFRRPCLVGPTPCLVLARSYLSRCLMGSVTPGTDEPVSSTTASTRLSRKRCWVSRRKGIDLGPFP